VDDDFAGRRIVLLSRIWKSLATRLDFRPDEVRLNYDVLAEVVGSYFRHLQRFKADQGIEWADRHKSGGFMMHWICRLKPIQCLVFREDGKQSPENMEPLLLANELFAIQAGISCLEATSDLLGDFDFFDSLIQRLRERECPPEFLSSMLYLYERLRQSESPPENQADPAPAV
jgi:hypothetical protein